MIVVFIGNLGSGKTLSMTKFLYADFLKGKRIMANYGLKFPYEKIDFNKAYELLQDEDLKRVSIGVDEAHIFLDSRSSSTKKNKLISYFLLQTRKRSINLYLTTQYFNQVDKRLRQVTDKLIICSKIKLNSGLLFENDVYKKNMLGEFEPQARLFYNPQNFYKLYDTNEIIKFDVGGKK